MKILAHAQSLIYQLLEVMPSPYQWQKSESHARAVSQSPRGTAIRAQCAEVGECAESISFVYIRSVWQIMRHLRHAIRRNCNAIDRGGVALPVGQIQGV